MKTQQADKATTKLESRYLDQTEPADSELRQLQAETDAANIRAGEIENERNQKREAKSAPVEKVALESRARVFHFSQDGKTLCGKSSMFMRRVAFGQKGDGLPCCIKCDQKMAIRNGKAGAK